MVDAPVPSILTATETEVSFVLRETLAVRLMCFSGNLSPLLNRALWKTPVC
jgi:hypothetical protein